MKANRLVTVEGQDWKANEWITTCLGPLARTKFTVGGRTQWYFTKAIRLPKVSHPVRILVLWPRETAPRPGKSLITNRTHWAAHRILKGYRRRWTGTETFHRDGKQHLGMGECQLRTGAGQTRHMHLVGLVYTALMRQLQHDRAQDWAQMRLTTIGEACRLIARETLAKTLAWVVEHVHAGRPFDDIKHALALP